MSQKQVIRDVLELIDIIERELEIMRKKLILIKEDKDEHS